MRWTPTTIAPVAKSSWTIVDPALASNDLEELAAYLISLARDGWPDEVDRFEIDVEHPATEQLLTKHRISTLLPANAVASDKRQEFRARLATIYGVQMKVEAAAATVLGILNAASIDSRVLKGLASAELDYPARQLRQTGDIDLAIRFDQFDEAVHLLHSRGYMHHSTVNSDFLLKGITLDAPNGVEVDLHTRLFQRSPATDLLFREPGEALADLPGLALPAHQRLVHAAGHFILTPPTLRRMSGLIDITRIRANPNLDLDKARVFAAEIGVEPLTAAALRLESELSGRGADDLDGLASWASPGWADRAARLSTRRNYVVDHFNRFREVQRKDWLRYLPEWLVPDQRLRRKFVASLRQRDR